MMTMMMMLILMMMILMMKALGLGAICTGGLGLHSSRAYLLLSGAEIELAF